MKKFLLIGVLVLATVAIMGSALYTKVAGYKTLLVSAAGAETDLIPATGYTVGVPSPGGTLNPINLYRLASSSDKSTKANAPILTCYATASENDDVTISIYGIREGGAPERIASLLFTFGQAIRSTGVRWADTCVATVTSTNSGRITVEDSGNNRIVSVDFDGKGFEYVYGIAHTTTTGSPTAITVPISYY
jgi:hypothetical protein